MDIVEIIQTLGFPIACCLGMGWYLKYTTDKNDAKIDKLNDTHNKALEKITTALNNNTVALTKLAERLGGAEEDDNK